MIAYIALGISILALLISFTVLSMIVIGIGSANVDLD